MYPFLWKGSRKFGNKTHNQYTLNVIKNRTTNKIHKAIKIYYSQQGRSSISRINILSNNNINWNQISKEILLKNSKDCMIQIKSKMSS